jgi:hypothetical protein
MITGKIGRADKVLNRTAHNVDLFQQRMGGFFNRAKQLVGTYLGFRAVKGLTTDYAAGADAIAKFATATGLSTDTYQGLIHVVKLGGTDTDNLNKAMTQLSKRALEATQGLKAQQRAFGELGVEVKDSEGKLKGADALFLEISDGLVNIKDDSRRTGLAMQLLGRTGATLLPTMLQGSKGIKALIEEAKKLGNVLSKEQLKAAENFNDEMVRVKAVLTGLRNQIASKLLPSITRMLRAFQLWWREGRNAERAMRAMKFVAAFTALVVGRLITAAVIKNVKAFVSGIWAGVQALRAMGIAGSITAAKVGLIFAALALVVLLVEDLVGFAQGKDSIIGRLLGDTKLAKDLRAQLLAIAKAVKDAWKELGPALSKSWADLKPALAELWSLIRPLIGPAFKAGVWFMVGSFAALAEGIRMTTSALKAMTKVVTFVVGFWTKAVGEARVGWAVFESNVKDGLKDIGKTANVIAKALGVDLSGAAKKVKAAWDLGLRGISKALDLLNAGLAKALKLKGLVFGVDLGSLDLEKVVAKTKAAHEVDFDTQGTPVKAGLFQPRGVDFFAGQVPVAALPGAGVKPITGRTFGPAVTNVTVSAGAVQMTATGSAADDPGLLAEAFRHALAGAVTDASRDITKPPRGQR